MKFIIQDGEEILIQRFNYDFIEKLPKDLPNIFTASSGATCTAGPINYPLSFSNLNINPRVGEHVFKGAIYQKLKGYTYVIGLVYFDRARKECREDTFTLHTDLMYIRKFTKTEFEKEYPEFKGFHTSQKDFFECY